MNENSKIIKAFTMVTQFTIHMLVPIGMCSYVGYLIDRKLGTSFAFILLFFVGAIAGGRNVYLLARKISEGDKYMPSKLYSSNQKNRSKRLEDERKVERYKRNPKGTDAGNPVLGNRSTNSRNMF